MIINDNAVDGLQWLDEKSVQTAITSPPYFQMRNYKAGDGEIGNEKTVAQYVARLVAASQAVKRVLKDDGTFWLNLGDSFDKGHLLGVPWRVAFALIDDGWVLRNEIIWNKPNPMPESCKNRLTKAHEQVFLFTKKPSKYKFNQLMEPAVYAGVTRGGSTNRYEQNESGMDARTYDTRNKRDVWTVRPATLHGYHSAIFPDELIAPCIEAGSDPGDIVLDPFSGSGTTGVVARKLGRDYIGVELSAEYAELSKERISGAWKVQRPTTLQTWHKSYQMTAEAFDLKEDEKIREAHEEVSSMLDAQREAICKWNDAIDELLGASSASYLRLIAGAEDPDLIKGFDELVDQATRHELYTHLLACNDNPETALFESLKEGKRILPRFEEALDEFASEWFARN